MAGESDLDRTVGATDADRVVGPVTVDVADEGSVGIERGEPVEGRLLLGEIALANNAPREASAAVTPVLESLPEDDDRLVTAYVIEGRAKLLAGYPIMAENALRSRALALDPWCEEAWKILKKLRDR